MMWFGRIKKLIFTVAAGAILLSGIGQISAKADDEYSTKSLLENAKSIIKWEKNQAEINENESLFSGSFLKNAGQDNADWFVIGASRLGLDEDYQAYASALEENILQKYENDGGLDEIKATEWHREILTVLSCGGNPTDFGEINLVEDGIWGRSEENSAGKQGLNGWVWSLIALDSYKWKTPENAMFTRTRIIDEILSQQLSDGEFALGGQVGEPDITAMVLQAIAPYYTDGGQDKVRQACEKALDFLSDNQSKNGTFETCETTAQVVCALCSLGINIQTDERFIKDRNVFDALLLYRNSDGGYAHIIGENSQGISSAQTLIAIASMVRYESTMRRVYDFTEEFSVLEREKIDAINGQLGNISKETLYDEMYDCNALYNGLSTDLKSYIYNYKKLLENCQGRNITLSDRNFINEMSQNETGNGCIYDVENTQILDLSDDFSEDDLQSYMKLKKSEISASDRLKIAILLSKAEKSDKLENRDEIVAELENMKQKSEEIYSTINKVNSQIANGLYPFKNLSNEQKKAAEQIYDEVMNLSDDDKELVAGYALLEKFISNERNTTKITKVSATIISCSVVLVVGIAIIFVRKKKGEKVAK